MRLVHWLIALAAALLLGAWLAPMLSRDPGYVLVRFQGWAFETTATALAVALLVLLIAWRVLVWFVRTPRRAVRRALRRRHEARLERGLLALAEGRWRDAQKLLAAEGRHSRDPAVPYLIAARAAQAGGNEADMENYLALAGDAGPRKELAVHLTRAELLLAEDEPEAAAAVLESLRETHPRNPRVLEMLSRCYRRLGRWRALAELAPTMRKLRGADATGLEREALVGACREAGDAGSLEEVWSSMGKRGRQDPAVVRAWAGRALELGDDGRVALRLPPLLRRHWDAGLVELYGRTAHPEPSRALKVAEGWLKDHREDPELLLALGRLCRQAGLTGKARQYLESSLAIRARAAAYRELAELLQAEGDAEGAMACYRRLALLADGDGITGRPRLAHDGGEPEDNDRGRRAQP